MSEEKIIAEVIDVDNNEDDATIRKEELETILDELLGNK